ncbi:hypothetical protein PVAP13_8KG238701 [Panicum virgatum]|uniref:Uncharacterized protein n=1 Tax=Panicum virgatum TaxID=38727 RepID=A0A8T0PIU8_PANVG|nr:hypothetical protein PVAP13_8KG238701 [Panicum virgatum]
MAATLKIFAFLFLYCLSIGGNAYEPCKLSDLVVAQTVKARHEGGCLEIAVTVENRCICTQSNVKLACKGFSSSVHVYPAGILQTDGNGLCSLGGGNSIGNAVKFSYWSTAQISFAPVSSTIGCSAG